MIMPSYEGPDEIPGVEDPGMQELAGVEHEILEFYPGTRRARGLIASRVAHRCTSGVWAFRAYLNSQMLL